MEFFKELLESYNERYDRWESSTSHILAILRKMRKITKKNTEDLVVSINKIKEAKEFIIDNFSKL